MTNRVVVKLLRVYLTAIRYSQRNYTLTEGDETLKDSQH